MSLNVLSKDILLKAENEKENLESQLKKDKESLEEEFESSLNSFKDREYSSSKSSLDVEMKKILSLYKKESRSLELFAKTQVLEEVFENTLAELNALKGEDKKKLFEKLIARAKDFIEFERIVCSKSNSKIVKELSPDSKVSVVENVNGLIFETSNKKQILNMTYLDLLKDIVENNEDKIQKILFEN